jgi:hypothetical protein
MAMGRLAQHVIRPKIEAAGIPWYGWHGFCRAIASNLFALGADEKVVPRVLRHVKPHVTKDRYIKVVRRSCAVGDIQNASESRDVAAGDVRLLARTERNWPAGKTQYRGKLKITNRGEVAERLNAAVC